MRCGHIYRAPVWRTGATRDFALCTRVDNLWMDWHPTRISWAKEKLPTTETEMHKVYRWMLTSMDNAAKHQTGTASPDAHCKTVMFTMGERR